MNGHVLALSGGVGGAKLAAGLCAVLPPERLTIAVNTGDDFEHLGLTICPDLDSVTYALADLNDTAKRCCSNSSATIFSPSTMKFRYFCRYFLT